MEIRSDWGVSFCQIGDFEHIDMMTGLRNQIAFFEDVKRIIARKQNSTITLIGIRKLAEINEIHGYSFGNSTLQHVGEYLNEVASEVGYVYHIDGSKFAIISGNLDTERILEYYELLRRHFRHDFTIDNQRLVLDFNAATLYLHSFDVDEKTIYSCLNYSYSESKVRHQGDMVIFSNSASDDNRFRLERLHAIRDAIVDGCKGFYLLFQPIMNAKTEKFVGAESLLRWRNDKYGSVPPDEFIGPLERDPLFPELGKWILKQSLYAAKEMITVCPDFIINVNLSYVQLEKSDFADTVLDIVKEVGFPEGHLCLEITERCRLLDIGLLSRIIERLHQHGILFALDDFGTGFSAIDIIKKLSFDTIKIDRGFISNIEKDDKERQLVGHFAGIAGTFGAKVCVEGVESNGMRDILQHFNVNSFQGYLYSKPVPIYTMMDLLDEETNDKFKVC